MRKIGLLNREILKRKKKKVVFSRVAPADLYLCNTRVVERATSRDPLQFFLDDLYQPEAVPASSPAPTLPLPPETSKTIVGFECTSMQRWSEQKR